eukprot:sb/3474311/
MQNILKSPRLQLRKFLSKKPPGKKSRSGPKRTAPPIPKKAVAPKRPPAPPGSSPAPRGDGKMWGEALWSYEGSMSCDLTFKEKDRIEILTKTEMTFDWWEGRLNGKRDGTKETFYNYIPCPCVKDVAPILNVFGVFLMS